ncbi:MAG: DUF2341 domain-containing protein, partial [Lentisphaerae bacterium]|nr:DUF2341 domain-containing protein [Lentisphaerota bacterium]
MRKLLSLTFAFLLVFSGYAENYSEWQKQMTITFDGYTRSETLIDFPVLIILEETLEGAGFLYSDFKTLPYGDLRFLSENLATSLAYEVEAWNQNGRSYVWVKIPELTQGTMIYMLWGKPGATTPASDTDGSVWNDDFAGVWHLNDLNTMDSTKNNEHGDYQG